MALDLSALDQVAVPAAVRETAARAPLAAFEEDPDNPRFEHDEADFLALVESVRVHGILQPVIVRRQPDGKLRIRFGARRLRSARVAGLADLPYVVTDDERQFDDYAQVAENEQRAPLQPLELARFIEKRLAAGETKRAIARRLGKDPSALTHLLALAGEPPALILALYNEHRCRTPQYLYELRRLCEMDPERVRAACSGVASIDRQFVSALAERLAGSEYAGTTEKDSSTRPGRLPVVRDAAVEAHGPASGETHDPTRRAAHSDLVISLHSIELLGQVAGRQVTLNLRERPSAPDRLIVNDTTGACSEVAIEAIQLTAVRFAGTSGEDA